MANRDTTRAHLALIDKEKTAARKAEAERMLSAGKTVREIIASLRGENGISIGGSTICRLRKKLKRQAAAAKAAKSRADARLAEAELAEPVAQVTKRLNGNAAEFMRALVSAGVPFSFNGNTLTVSVASPNLTDK